MNTSLRNLRALSATGLIAWSCASRAGAQVGRGPMAGDRIRVSVPALGYVRMIGQVISINHETLVLRVKDKSADQQMSLANISAMDLSSGMRGHKLKGAGIGFLVGIVGGAAAGFASGNDGPPIAADMRLRAEEKAVGLGLVFGLAGAGIGTMWGALVKTEQWSPVAVKR